MDPCIKISKGIFQFAIVPVIASSWIESDLRFTEFTHAEAVGLIRYFYLLEFDDAHGADFSNA